NLDRHVHRHNVRLSGLTADPRYPLVHSLGIAIGQASTENLGDTTKKGFAPPVKNTFAWWGGAVNIVGTGSVTPALQTLITQNNLQFNGSLGTSADTVFARTYDRYLVANKGSSVDNVFIDYNNAGDWTYGGGSGAFTAGDIATPGFKNTVFNGNKPAVVPNPDDLHNRNINPLQGTGQNTGTNGGTKAPQAR